MILNKNVLNETLPPPFLWGGLNTKKTKFPILSSAKGKEERWVYARLLPKVIKKSSSIKRKHVTKP